MSGDSVQDQFKQFLADNKIDVSALAGTKEEERFYKDVENQRALGIVKAVSHCYSFNWKNHFWLFYNGVIDLFIETRCLSFQELWAVSPKVWHCRLHQWVPPWELLRSLRHQGPRTAFPLSSRRYMLEKLHNKILCLLSHPPQQSRHCRLPPLRAATRSRGR